MAVSHEEYEETTVVDGVGSAVGIIPVVGPIISPVGSGYVP